MKKELGTGAHSLGISLLALSWGHSSGLGFLPSMGEVFKIPPKDGDDKGRGERRVNGEKGRKEQSGTKISTTKNVRKKGAFSLFSKRNIILI